MDIISSHFHSVYKVKGTAAQKEVSNSGFNLGIDLGNITEYTGPCTRIDLSNCFVCFLFVCFLSQTS